jgi:hypothetical protein
MEDQSMAVSAGGSMTMAEVFDGHLGAYELHTKDHTAISTLVRRWLLLFHLQPF